MEARSVRAETGLMKFGDDWCGVFIRGDNAMYYGQLIELVLERAVAAGDESDAIYRVLLKNFAEFLMGSDERTKRDDVQQMKAFEQARSE